MTSLAVLLVQAAFAVGIIIGLAVAHGARTRHSNISSASVAAPSLVGRTVVVHTRGPDAQSIRGILATHHADRLTLREAIYLHGTSAVDVAGLIHVPLASVSTVQEIMPVAELS